MPAHAGKEKQEQILIRDLRLSEAVSKSPEFVLVF